MDSLLRECSVSEEETPSGHQETRTWGVSQCPLPLPMQGCHLQVEFMMVQEDH